jgi:hypothetical protein
MIATCMLVAMALKLMMHSSASSEDVGDDDI